MTNKIKTPWGGGLNSLKPRKLAFTLAEVLITLAIIGIVAALTIPTLVSKNEKKQLYTQFMKSYNTISNALNIAMVDFGDPSAWVMSDDYIPTYLLPYLKNVNVCEAADDCFVSNYTDLKGNSMESIVSPILEANPYAIQLASGASIFKSPGSNELVIDTNGKKGPNVFSRDLFALSLNEPTSTVCKGKPLCVYYENSLDLDECVASNGFYLSVCTRKLLIEGAMNY